MDPWECPRCHTINAGWVGQCLCPPATTTGAESPITVTVKPELPHIRKCTCPVVSTEHSRGPGCFWDRYSRERSERLEDAGLGTAEQRSTAIDMLSAEAQLRAVLSAPPKDG